MAKDIRPLRYEGTLTLAMRRALGDYTAPAPTLRVATWEGTRA